MIESKQLPQAVYSRDQIARYFKYIGFTDAKLDCLHNDTSNSKTEHPSLSILSRLIKLHQQKIPFEDLELHYSQHRSISLDPQHLFHKFITKRHGRGGYCMEHNTFFGDMLRSLGYDVLSTGGRVSNMASSVTLRDDPGSLSFQRWSHMVNIVTISNHPYLVDVGFGNNAPTAPIPLKHNYSCLNVGSATGGSQLRLTQDTIPDTTHDHVDQRLWIYSIRFRDTSPWLPCYCFSLLEFLPRDFEMMNFFVSQYPASWFRDNLICSRAIYDEVSDCIVGNVTLQGKEIKERRYGKSLVLCTVESEEERVVALRQYLGVTLTGGEIEGITGAPTEIV